jgi:ferredoxin/flavodoxin---NADP+ reductase
MAFVITQACCNDAGCATACPVDCIHPMPDDPDFGHTEMLYIDPSRCIDCAACAEVCPVDAIFPDDELPSSQTAYASINAHYFLADPRPAMPPTPSPPAHTTEPLAVAVVGAGPSGFYAAAALLDAGPHVTVSLIDRLPTPYGLVRAGVAPDHQDTKRITTTFAATAAHPRLSTYFNVEVSTDLSHGDLSAHHHAVIYATGAAAGRRPGIPGDDLSASLTAADVVGWYNGHPDYTDISVSAEHPTAVIIGNGNVALDVARILLLGGRMIHTDIADHALEGLSDNAVREVIVIGRRGPEHAAFSLSQLLALAGLEDVDIVVDAVDLAGAAVPADQCHPAAFATETKLALLREMAARKPRHGRRIHLKFATSVRAILGADRVEAVSISSAAAGESTIPAGIVVSCIGFDGQPVAGIAFDNSTKRVPNRGGRVIDPTGQVVSGQYVTGWIKRGPSGVIGTNKACAAETVDALLDDHRRGLLPAPSEPPAAFADTLVRRSIRRVDRRGWLRIDDHERREGARSGRPRRKSVHRTEMLELARNSAGSTLPTPSTDQPRRTL